MAIADAQVESPINQAALAAHGDAEAGMTPAQANLVVDGAQVALEACWPAPSSLGAALADDARFYDVRWYASDELDAAVLGASQPVEA